MQEGDLNSLQGANRRLWRMQECDLNIFQGANNMLNELAALIQVKANEVINELKG